MLRAIGAEATANTEILSRSTLLRAQNDERGSEREMGGLRPTLHDDAVKDAAPERWWPGRMKVGSGGFGEDFIGAHHFVVFVFEDVAVPDVAAGVALELDDDAGGGPGGSPYRVFPAAVRWARGDWVRLYRSASCA